MTVWLEIAIVVGLTLLNGFFAMAELAIASSRRIRLQQMAEAGSRGAARALTLAENPGRFLSAVQVGITLIGIMSGAYGGATLGARLGEVLNEYPIFAPRGGEIAFILVVIAITALVGRRRRTRSQAHRPAATGEDRRGGFRPGADPRAGRASAGLVSGNVDRACCSSCCASRKSAPTR